MQGDKDDTERDLAEADGMRPDEPAGPDESEASPARSEFRAGERTGGVEESAFEVADQVHEEFPVEPIPMGTDPTDGMPSPIMGDPQDALAVPFTYDTQLCITDDRAYVELWQDELKSRGWVKEASTENSWRTPGGYLIPLTMRSCYSKTGEQHTRNKHKPEEVEHLWGVYLIKREGAWQPVRPIRELCKHYQRQVFSNDNQPDMTKPGHQLVFRVCAARRSNGGAFMSLRDEGIYQCDFRNPPDERSTRLQDSKDLAKVRQRPDLLLIPMFNMPGDAVQKEETKPS